MFPISPQGNIEGFARVCGDRNILARSKSCRQEDVELLLPSQPKALCSVSNFVLQRHNPHAHLNILGCSFQRLDLRIKISHQVAPVNSFVAFGDYSSHSKEEGTLCSPVSAGATTIILASQHDQVRACLLVLLGRVKHVEDVVGRDVQGLWPRLANQLVHLSTMWVGGLKKSVPVGYFQRFPGPSQHHCLVGIQRS